MNTVTATPAIRVQVDPTNPGQFFACCGLFEVASRLCRSSEGWFENERFMLRCNVSLQEILRTVRDARLIPFDPENPTTSPLMLPTPIDLCLDWWLDSRAGGSIFKTWAGQQKVVSIASAMQAVINSEALDEHSLLNTSAVLYDGDGGKVEPFYLDARRASQSHSLDVGFSPDAQKLLMPVFSAVEFLCLIGLQRFRPLCVREEDHFEYCAWIVPLSISIASAAAAGLTACPGSRFKFQLLYRTKYLKGFLPATRIITPDGGSNHD
jgi:hypothetical protein